MSVAGISSSDLFDYNTQSVQSKIQQFQQDFRQLGQDLQSGNLSGAQAEFASLQQFGPRASQSSNPIAQEFNQLSQDLQSGNLSGAQQGYATIQQDFQSQAAQMHHHHHHDGGGSAASAISQLPNQLDQALQSGNISAAQQAYGTLQRDFQQFTQSTGALTQVSPQPSAKSTSVNA